MPRRDLLLTIYLLSFLSILAFAIAEPSLPIAAIGLLTSLIAWRLSESGRPALPRWIVNAGVLFASLFLFWEVVIQRQENLLLGLGHFLIAVLICKLFDLRTKRDDAQAGLVSLLIVITAAIFASSVSFGIIFFFYLLVGLQLIVLMNIHRPEEPILADMAPRARRDLRRLIFKLSLLLIIFGVIIFILTPRGSRQPFAAWMAGRGLLQTGFTSDVHLGDFGRLQQNDSVVMHVRLEQNGRSIGSEDIQPYFRGGTLDVYDSERGRWQRSTYVGRQSYEVSLNPNEEVQIRDAEGQPTVRQYYTLMMNTGSTLFTMQPVLSVHSASNRRLVVSELDGTLNIQAPNTEGLEYDVESVYSPHAMMPIIQPAEGGRYEIYRTINTISEVDPIARDVAGHLFPRRDETLTTARTEALAARFEQYLRTNYPYSLQIRTVDPKLDRTVDFLLNRKKIGGHCEYFASAMVMMCRAAGLQARIVSGYHGGEYNSVGGFYVVRQKYAHAWVEVLIPDRGWVQYDPSPTGTESAEQTIVSSWLRWFQELGQVVQRSWLSSVISFDNTTRQYLAEKFWYPVVDVYKNISDNIQVMYTRMKKSGPTVLAVQIFFGVCLLGAIGAAIFLLPSLMLPAPKMSASLAARRQRDLITALEHRYKKRHSASQTAREFLQSLAMNPSTSTVVDSALTLIESVRYGTRQWTPQQDHQLKEQIRNISKNM